ncbi:hypothetical protein FNV43_RR25373 [Rhamnella rubrinervis]|uniref:Calcineurin-like phosphoesterase domain-containing protein n=1 Tax=Rhamnella rubrinervis TaxID=2594499 RepID=A0A8K0DNG7_9ROSA|nr:hypothetical protein FNV43_RR25373 [Rhamnella rubrinervis]
MSLVARASSILHKEPNLLHTYPYQLVSSVVVVGDLHGHLHDMLFIPNDADFPSENRIFIFNGDFVDRGP